MELDFDNLRSTRQDFQLIVQIFPNICPGKTKKVHRLELDLASFDYLGAISSRLLKIFKIYVQEKTKKRNKEKSGLSGARFGQMIVQIYSDLPEKRKNKKSRSLGARFSRICLP